MNLDMQVFLGDFYYIIFWNGLVFIVGLDVVRTDRTLVFYEKQENLSKLWDILAVYGWFDSDIGYCQGESQVNLFLDVCPHCLVFIFFRCE